ncbi:MULTISPECIES: competence protein CoiA family protein [unclassified Polaromonas]|uniref:competence protein CoiA family protein n=1 Tax=unclassified Polaromonas TaxID=2638319 RepID=UPI000BCE4ECE|nr:MULTISPECIES: competence protein CoiA family protein [unclassified Polaromonas]OYZ15992.1 MAG: hypothetical protein B7Y28_21725 [Polaromonas sp. 16-63-31]OZA47007.1 MAG: hypothetical protein B7X88_22960 [Polaromonas sp. 17-63-33]
MSEIFAGVTVSGETRLIGEVAQGAACGCFCRVCGSPLVAKQGEVLTWHFAHVARQENPECYAGALNLIRRLAIEDILGKAVLKLPECHVTIRRPSRLGHSDAKLAWQPEFERWVDFAMDAPKGATVARIHLVDGEIAELSVEATESPISALPVAVGDAGMIVCRFPIPAPKHLRTFEAAMAQIRATAAWQWIRVPAGAAQVKRAIEQLDAQDRLEAARIDKLAHQRAIEAGSRWAGIARRNRAGEAFLRPRPAFGPPPTGGGAEDALPGRSPGCTLTFYRLPDSKLWVRYMRSDRRYVVIPFPGYQWNGWENDLPPAVGRYDPELKAFVLDDVFRGMEALAALSSTVKSGRSLAEFTSDPFEN